MARSKQTAVGGDTREALILAAERLIAKFGIDDVSLRQINTEAGQRNSSAAHYHFGSKDALIRSIYEYRIGSVNSRRKALLDAVRADGREHDVRSLVATIIQPIVDEIEGSSGGSFYIRFLSQAIGHPQATARDYFDNVLTDAALSAYELIKTALPDVREPVLGQRFGLMWEMIIHSLADRERFRRPGANNDGIESERFVNNLIDVVAGGLAAPISGPTAQTLTGRVG